MKNAAIAILLNLFLSTCTGSNSYMDTAVREAVVASCNKVIPGELIDPGLACFRMEHSLPSAVQFGDSVSMGYGIDARHDLCGVADYRHDDWSAGDINVCGEAYNPYDGGLILNFGDNNGDSFEMLTDMENQLAGKHYNVILFNSGYHDIAQGIPDSAYRNNLEVAAQICAQSADICIWVDTPGLGVASLPLANAVIDAGSVSQYNSIAHRVARAHGFYIVNMPDQNHDGTVHFNSLGYFNAGAVIAACVITALQGGETPDCYR